MCSSSFIFLFFFQIQIAGQHVFFKLATEFFLLQKALMTWLHWTILEAPNSQCALPKSMWLIQMECSAIVYSNSMWARELSTVRLPLHLIRRSLFHVHFYFHHKQAKPGSKLSYYYPHWPCYHIPPFQDMASTVVRWKLIHHHNFACGCKALSCG
jgi:hypothetical protein